MTREYHYSPGWDASPSQVAPRHLCPKNAPVNVKSDTVKIKHLAKEQNNGPTQCSHDPAKRTAKFCPYKYIIKKNGDKNRSSRYSVVAFFVDISPNVKFYATLVTTK